MQEKSVPFFSARCERYFHAVVHLICRFCAGDGNFVLPSDTQVYRDASFEEKRRIVSALVEEVRVSRGYKIQIMFRVGVDLLEGFAEETGNVTEEAS